MNFETINLMRKDRPSHITSDEICICSSVLTSGQGTRYNDASRVDIALNEQEFSCISGEGQLKKPVHA